MILRLAVLVEHRLVTDGRTDGHRAVKTINFAHGVKSAVASIVKCQLSWLTSVQLIIPSVHRCLAKLTTRCDDRSSCCGELSLLEFGQVPARTTPTTRSTCIVGDKRIFGQRSLGYVEGRLRAKNQPDPPIRCDKTPTPDRHTPDDSWTTIPHQHRLALCGLNVNTHRESLQ